jgi:hypothetical protein
MQEDEEKKCISAKALYEAEPIWVKYGFYDGTRFGAIEDVA